MLKYFYHPTTTVTAFFFSELIPVSFLTTRQEEADTRIIRHCSYALTLNATNGVIQSPSGDTYITLAVSLVRERENVYVDNGNGKNRNIIHLSQLAVKDVNSLIGFHAFSSNDYASAFFGKDKKMCWKKNERFT